MSHRKLLIGVSIAGHAALFTSAFVASSWDVDRLDYKRARTSLAVIVPPPAESSSSYTPRPREKLDRKRPRVAPPTLTQRPARPLDLPIDAPSTPGDGADPGAGPGRFGGVPGLGEPCTDVDGQPCRLAPEVPELPALPPPPPPPPPRPQAVDLPPDRLVRQSGNTHVLPPRDALDQMVREGTRTATAALRVCITEQGTVSSVERQRSTGYPSYDDELVAAARGWIYLPYRVGGVSRPACSLVTFQYAMK
jgi:TonB family protein